MKSILSVICVLSSFFCNQGIKFSAKNNTANFNSPGSGENKAAIQAARDMLQTHMKLLDIPGMQIAVAIQDKLIWSESFGYSDIENKTPVTSNTAFRIGSLSKSLTGAGLGLLIHQKKINPDSPVNFYVPSFPKKRWSINVGQLAYHTSGIRHYNSNEEASSTVHYTHVTESLKQFAGDSLLFKPGDQFEYSSFGYVLLSAIMESASKQAFPDFMKDKVFSPLGMKNTTMDYTDREIPFRSKFYTIDDNDKRIIAPLVDNSSKWAAGGMVSTAEDLVLFGNALLNETFLNHDITNLLFTQGKTNDGKETGYGIGWEIRTDNEGRKVIVNDGSLPSARGVLLIYPKEKLVMSILMNTGSSVFFNREEALMLADLFLNPAGLNPSVQEKKSAGGKYTYRTFLDEDSIAGEINISEKDGRLSGTMTIPNRFFKDRVIKIPVVKVVNNNITIFGIPGNWIYMTFVNTNKVIRGRWRFGPLKGELIGERL